MRPGEPPAPTTLPLLCALGRHKADGLARWNAGYYFARCTRCRRDLVRTAFTRWQIPRGFRVVWQGEMGGISAPVAEMLPHAGAPVEFPIREDVRPDRAAPADDETAYAERADEPAFSFDEARMPGEDRSDDETLAESVGEHARQDADGSPEEPDVRETSAAQVPSWFDGENRFEEGTRFGPDDRLVEFETAVGSGAEEPGQDAAAAVDEDEEPAAALFVDHELADEVAHVEPELEPEPVAPPPVSSKYPVVPDFMDESENGVGWEVVSGRIVPSPGYAAPDTLADARRDVPPGEPRPGWQDLARKRALKAGEQGREWLRGMRAPRRQPSAPAVTAEQAVAASAAAPVSVAPTPVAMPPVAEPAAPPVVPVKPRITVTDAPSSAVAPEPANGPVAPPAAMPSSRMGHFLMHQGPIAAAVIFGGFVLAAALVDGRETAQRVVYRPAPAAAPVVRTAPMPPVAKPAVPAWKVVAGRPAYVTAGLLKCRASPSNDADTVRRISRGATVQVIAVNPGWLDVSHQGERCWVSAQHVATKRPV